MSTLEVIWSASSIDLLTEKVLSAFLIPEVSATSLSQQFDLQRELALTIVYVEGRYGYAVCFWMSLRPTSSQTRAPRN